MTGDMGIVSFESSDAFGSSLSDRPAASAGLWLTLRKKGAGIVTFDYARPGGRAVFRLGRWAEGRSSTPSIGCSGSPRASRRASGPRSTGTRPWP